MKILIIITFALLFASCSKSPNLSDLGSLTEKGDILNNLCLYLTKECNWYEVYDFIGQHAGEGHNFTCTIAGDENDEYKIINPEQFALDLFYT